MNRLNSKFRNSPSIGQDDEIHFQNMERVSYQVGRELISLKDASHVKYEI